MKYNVVIILCLFHFISMSQTFYKGVDLSYVNELEDCGTIYYDQLGNEKDGYELFAEKGSNIVRLRLWHNPTWTNYSNLTDVKKSIMRAKDSGMEVLLDFHYSDFWTDPGRNWTPDAWEAIDDDAILGDSLYNYTFNTLEELHEEGLLPEMVQIGNETNGNILLKRVEADLGDGTPNLYPINWDRQAMLFNRALDAVDDLEEMIEKEVKTVIHVANAESAESWFAQAHENNLTNYDIIGLSYYPQWHEQDVREVGEYVASFKETFEKQIMLVEVGYPWTSDGSGDAANNVLGGPSRLSTYDSFSPEVQAEFLTELTWLVKENGGMGVIYWEPAWVSSSCQTYWGTGSHWDNATFFDFDNKLQAGVDFLTYDYNEQPQGLKDQAVTFKVNMEGVEDINDVFVTGDFTGEPWGFIAMTEQGEDIYEVTVPIQGRSSGAFIFYKNNDWDIEWREEVPAGCAVGSRRWLTIKNQPITYEYAWSSCNTQVVQNLLDTRYFSDQELVSVYPNPSSGLLTMDGTETSSVIQIFDTAGKEYTREKTHDGKLDITRLPNGIYYLRVTQASGTHQIKILKQ